jgi:hypothetical protein
MSVVDLTTLSAADITALCNAAPKRGYITPAIETAIDSGEVATNMDEKIEWPTDDDGTEKTLAQKVQALKQNIKNHQVKALQGKAKDWPNLDAIPAHVNGSAGFPMLVNVDALNAAKAAEANAEV